MNKFGDIICGSEQSSDFSFIQLNVVEILQSPSIETEIVKQVAIGFHRMRLLLVILFIIMVELQVILLPDL